MICSISMQSLPSTISQSLLTDHSVLAGRNCDSISIFDLVLGILGMQYYVCHGAATSNRPNIDIASQMFQTKLKHLDNCYPDLSTWQRAQTLTRPSGIRKAMEVQGLGSSRLYSKSFNVGHHGFITTLYILDVMHRRVNHADEFMRPVRGRINGNEDQRYCH